MIQHARRLLLSFGLASAMAFGASIPAAIAQVPYLQLIPANSTKYASIVVDAKSGEVLYSKRADSPRFPASITKVMTLYLTYEALAAGRITLEDRVVFSPHAAAQSPTKLGVRAGDSISVSEAIQAMCTLSANGLPNSRNISTARDIAILSRAAMRDYPQYYRYFSQTTFNFRGREIRNHNRMLNEAEGVDGLKTGFINASGFNIAISGVRDNRRLIVVVLGGPTRVTRDQVAASLLATGFEVIRRRNMGEDIRVAQNFFEPPQLAEAIQPSMQQGDAGESLTIRLASTTPPTRTSKIQIVETKSVPKLNGKGKAVAGGRWTVQVGTFSNRSDAREQLVIVEKKYGKHFDDARAVAEKDDGKFRARFAGMSETEAKGACRALKSRKQPCVVMSPRG